MRHIKYKAVIHLSALLVMLMVAGCGMVADAIIEDFTDRTTYGPYEVKIPDTPHERFASQDVTLEVYDPISWMEIRYSIKNTGSRQAEVAIRIKLLYRNDLEKETVKIKNVPPHSTVDGTIEASWDHSDSDLLEELIEDSNYGDVDNWERECEDVWDEEEGEYVEECTWEKDEELAEYKIRIIFNAIEGPPGLKAEFEVEVEEL